MSNVEARFPTSVSGGKPTHNQIENSKELRDAAVHLAEAIDVIPDGRWKSLALTALEESLMWANKANFNSGAF